jgi:hypothetical protein
MMCEYVQISSNSLSFRTGTFFAVSLGFVWLLTRLLTFTTVQGSIGFGFFRFGADFYPEF